MSFFSSLGKAAGSVFSGFSSGGLLGAIGGLGSDVFNYFNAKSYRNWMKHMSDTAVSRRYKDLASAGVNPILAGGSGGSASTPSAMPSSAGSPVSSAFAAATAKQNLANMKAQTDLVKAQTDNIRVATTANSAKANLDKRYYNTHLGRYAYYFDKFTGHTDGLSSVVSGAKQLARVAKSFM